MFKVFIADDEIYVLSLIERLIDWTAMGLEIVGTADNGLTAYDEIMRLKPDIVIVDVRMPGLDGISLMQKVRTRDERVRFLMISGHKRFEYAKSAMKYNVEDYILKPINKGELESNLRKITEKLTRERESARTQGAPDAAASASLGKLFLEQFMAGSLTDPEMTPAALRGKFLLNLQPGSYQIVIAQLLSREQALDSAFVETMMTLIENHFLERVGGMCYAVASHHVGRAATFFLNYPADAEAALGERIADFHETMRGILSKFETLSVTICLGAPAKRLEDLPGSLEVARLARRCRFALGIDRIIDGRLVRRSTEAQRAVFHESRGQLISAAIRSMDGGKIRIEVAELFARAEALRQEDNGIFADAAEFVLDRLYQYIRQLDLIKADFSTYRAGFEGRLDACVTPGDIAAAVTAEILGLIERYMGEGLSGEHPAVRIAKRYIAENYQSPITLKVISGIVNVSPIYFSAMFKKEVGVNFLDYLSQVRIVRAKELLSDARYNVGEVAAAVGFTDPRYFAKVFRKVVGVTPTEYRGYHAR